MAALSTAETLLAILGLAAVTVLSRAFFLITRRELPMPGWLERGLRYAPLAALSAVVVPEIGMTQGHLVDTWRDARLFAAVAAVGWFFWRRGMFGVIAVGMAVFLALRLGLGW